MHLHIMYKKNILLILTSLCFLIPLTGQVKCPVKKVYAYKQASLPGIQQRTPENGGAERKETFNYWFYITLPENKSININHIWIGGKKFLAKADVIENSPVIKISNSSDTDNTTIELVPKTKNKIILIYPSGANNDTELLSARMMKKIRKYELVISFTSKGKNRIARKRLIRILNPEALP